MSTKRKSVKKHTAGPKPKKPHVTLPLYPDFDEVPDEAEIMPVIGSKSDKRGGKTAKAGSNSAPAALAEHSSEGDDDDDFVDLANDPAEDEDGEATGVDDTMPSVRKAHKFKHRSRAQESTVAASSPGTSTDSDSSDDDIQDLAAKHIGRLSGALPDYDSFYYGESITTPIDSQIPSKIQRKIWENKYIDMAVLLPNTSYTNINANRRFSLQISHNSKISLVPNTYTKKINTIEQWTTAFLRFAAIYGLKYPKEMSKLMKYAEIVRDLANRKPGLSWLMYDIQFRSLRQSQRISWDQLHTEFWVMAATTSTFRPQRRQQYSFQDQQSNSQSRPRYLRDTCWTYNRFGRCNNTDCHWDHKCGFCRGRHCAKSCTSNNTRNGPSRHGQESQTQQQSGSQTQPSRSNRSDTRNQTQ
ncbi:MAG: hypothetical protein ABW092_14625 [Candidatus Thiodiazotropha sp.]